MSARCFACLALALLLLPVTPRASAQAVTFTVVHAFGPLDTSYHNADGSEPLAALTSLGHGVFEGTTFKGGPNGGGVIFFLQEANGFFSVYHAFYQHNGPNNHLGANPFGAPVEARNADLFVGSAYNGGDGSAGVVYLIKNGSLGARYFPQGSTGHYYKGAHPGLVIQADNNNFYGLCHDGGKYGGGTIFGYAPSYQIGIKVALNSSLGTNPFPGVGLLQASDGLLYGTAYSGGTNNLGTVFYYGLTGRIENPLGVSHSFTGPDGANPAATLIQGKDGRLYGTTAHGGTDNQGVVFAIDPATKAFTLLHSLSGLNGRHPQAALVQASDGLLYGTVAYGGAGGTGTVFRMAPKPPYHFTVIYSFSPLDRNGHNPDGAFPAAALVEGTDGRLYGSATVGGPNGTGTLFALDVGLTP